MDTSADRFGSVSISKNCYDYTSRQFRLSTFAQGK